MSFISFFYLFGLVQATLSVGCRVPIMRQF